MCPLISGLTQACVVSLFPAGTDFYWSMRIRWDGGVEGWGERPRLVPIYNRETGLYSDWSKKKKKKATWPSGKAFGRQPYRLRLVPTYNREIYSDWSKKKEEVIWPLGKVFGRQAERLR